MVTKRKQEVKGEENHSNSDTDDDNVHSKTKRIRQKNHINKPEEEEEEEEESVHAEKSFTTNNMFQLPEIYNRIFSFLSADDLCILDLVSKEFKTIKTASAWNNIATKRFGLFIPISSSSSSSSSISGKERWRRGISFLRTPTLFALEDRADSGYGCMYGDATMATNQSILVGVAEDEESTERTFPAPRNPMGIRHAYSLNYCQTMPSPIRNSEVTICGRIGSETIVTTNRSHVAACRGNASQTISIHDLDINNGNRSKAEGDGDGSPCIGCETHLILVALQTIQVFEVAGVDLTRDDEHLLRHVRSIPLPLCNESSQTSKDPCEAVDWSPDKSHFAVCYPHVVYIYKFNSNLAARKARHAGGGEEDGSVVVVQVQEIPILQDKADDDCQAENVELAENYVVVSLKGKKLRVYDRHSSFMMYDKLCDVSESELVELEYIEYPISMVSVGDILLSSSHIGASNLCIWNMRTGKLLKSHKIEENDSLHECGCDVTGLLYLHRLNAVVMMSYTMAVIGFPFGCESKMMLTSIRRRERNMQRAWRGLRPGEMMGDSDRDSEDDSDSEDSDE